MARMRLHGLIGTYPNDLGLRHILGQLYLEIGKPWKAGRFLYLIDDKSKETHEAIREFLILYDEPRRILRRLRVKGHIDDFEPGFAKDKLQDVLDDCGIKDGQFPKYERTKPSTLNSTFIWMICGTWILIMISVVYGLIPFFKWLVRLIIELF